METIRKIIGALLSIYALIIFAYMSLSVGDYPGGWLEFLSVISIGISIVELISSVSQLLGYDLMDFDEVGLFWMFIFNHVLLLLWGVAIFSITFILFVIVTCLWIYFFINEVLDE